ncbi:MAG: nitroreductase family protein [Chitinophagales bacterium]
MTRWDDLQAAVRARHSVRRFLPDPVPEADIREIVELATWAPNASNRQMWRFVAVADPALKKAMRQAVEEAIDRLVAAVPEVPGVAAMKGWSLFFAEAPVVIAVFGEGYASRTDEALKAGGWTSEAIDRVRARPDLQSIGAAIQTLLLAAAAKGYGTCWMCAPNLAAPEIERLLGVEERFRLVAIVPLGCPAEAPRGPGRHPVEEVYRYLGPRG